MSLGRALTSEEVAHLLWSLELQEGWPRREYVPHLPFRQDQNRGRNVSAGDQADAPAQQGDRLGLQLACGGGRGLHGVRGPGLSLQGSFRGVEQPRLPRQEAAL